jgi:drug/metabolite transporter (DMT)-like permease
MISALTLAAIMLALGKLKLKGMPNKKLLLFCGAINAAGYLLQYIGMPYTTSAKAALFINLSAMWVALMSPKLLGETFSHKKIIGVLFGLVGIIFVSTNLDISSLNQGQVAGDSLLILSGIAWAIFMVYNKKLMTHSATETFQAMTWILIFTFLTIIPFTILAGPGFFTISTTAWLGNPILPLARRFKAPLGFSSINASTFRNCNGSITLNCNSKRTSNGLLNNRRSLNCYSYRHRIFTRQKNSKSSEPTLSLYT